jgi:hypothetical protein
VAPTTGCTAAPADTGPAHATLTPAARGLRATVTYDAALGTSYSGRVYLMTSSIDQREPRDGPSWFGTQPFFAMDVIDWTPGTPLLIDGGTATHGYPGPLSELPPGTYWVQAVIRRNPDSPRIGTAAGNAYSRRRQVTISPDGAASDLVLHIDQVVVERPFRETRRLRLVELRSDLLSAFHGRDIVMRAAVILPRGYDAQSSRRYPTQYVIGGFGSDHRSAPGLQRRSDASAFGDQLVRVIPDPQCFGGHHVFADSASNGPRGRALVEELIPHLERSFALVPESWGRFVSGHSSGGWSSLWLQVTYPTFFGGTWSSAPDPVDFRDFQRIDLYEPGANMYRDPAGARRPLARRGTTVVKWYDDFAAMDVVHGEGGQLRSFEWVFSPRGEDGLPLPLYDRESGAVDPAVAAAWRRYDIQLILERNWTQLREPLAGKIHVFMGELDTFYLEGATRLLQQTLSRLGSDATIEFFPGADHGSFATTALHERIDGEMIEHFERARATRERTRATDR